MSLSIQESQRTLFFKMLDISTKNDISSSWKVLIYDKTCQDILATQIKVGGLRQHGVTLNLQIECERKSLPEVPAIYFVEPSIKNINIIIEDIQKGLYKGYYINFLHYTPISFLQLMAQRLCTIGKPDCIEAIYDRYLDFVSLSPSLFSLNTCNFFFALHNRNTSDLAMESIIDKVVNGLISTCITLGTVPIVRCPTKASSPAQMIAIRFQEKIQSLCSDNLSSPFSGTSLAYRPVLILLDRDFDIDVMIRHKWTYQALIDDLYDFKLNRVTLQEPSDNGVSKARTYDLDNSDDFWSRYASATFTDVAMAISESLNDYNRRVQELSQKNDEIGIIEEDAGTGNLASAISALPEMTEKKKSLDMHTKIATMIANEIKARGLDRYYELENDLSNLSDRNAVQQILNLLNSQIPGTQSDQLRAVMSLLLNKPNISPESRAELTNTLAARGISVHSLSYLNNLHGLKEMQISSEKKNVRNFGNFGNISTLFMDKSKGILLRGIKHVFQHLETLPLISLIDHFTSNTQEDSTYRYMDSKAHNHSGNVPRMRSPFKQAIVFVVGGGNFEEAAALQEFATKSHKQIIYGATDMCSPQSFLQQLDKLGEN